MAIQVKKAGSYVATTSVFLKKAGAYVPVLAVFAKVGGVYKQVFTTVYRSIFTQEISALDVSNAGRIIPGDTKRTSIIIRNPNNRPLAYKSTTAANNNRNNPGGTYNVLAAGQEIYITGSDALAQWWVQPKQYVTSSITSSGTTATVTTPAHGLSTGDFIVLTYATPTAYNLSAAAAITVIDVNTFTYQTTTSDIATATGQGTVRVANLIAEVELMGVL